MKGPKDSKESHTSVTMEGTAGTGVGRGPQPLSERGTAAEELLSAEPFVCPCAEPASRWGGHRQLFRMLGACSSPPPPAHPLLPTRRLRREPC